MNPPVIYLYGMDKEALRKKYMEEQFEYWNIKGNSPLVYPVINPWEIEQSREYYIDGDAAGVKSCAITLGKSIAATATDSNVKVGHLIVYERALKLSEIRRNFELLREFYVLDPAS